MFSLLLAIIYISFISLGLPDSLLGSAWPVMHQDIGAPLSVAGVITMVIAGGTIISSLFSAKIINRVGTGAVTAVSVFMTAVALFGFSVSDSVLSLCLWGIPYGLGAGCVDSALNNYVALHYAARHMSWLHCFWGVGCSISPYIMSFCLTRGYGWDKGYLSVSILQVVLCTAIFISLPLWKKPEKAEGEEKVKTKSIAQTLKIKGVVFAILTFFAYCSLEATAGLWATSYFVEVRGINEYTAAKFASLFYLGITFGRFINGFLSEKLSDKALVRIGSGIILAGIIFVFISFIAPAFALAGLLIIGLGCAPVYPCLIHTTPISFGKENSQSVIGLEMATAYVGTTFMPPLFGVLGDNISLAIFPAFLLFFALLMVAVSELLNSVHLAK